MRQLIRERIERGYKNPPLSKKQAKCSNCRSKDHISGTCTQPQVYSKRKDLERLLTPYLKKKAIIEARPPIEFWFTQKSG